MYIPNSVFSFINIAIILICLLNIVMGYKKGLVYQLLTLLSFVGAFLVAYLLAPIFAGHIALIPNQGTVVDMISAQLLNYVIWLVLILVVAKIVFSIVIQVSRIVSHIPLIGFVNKVAGAAFGLVNSAIWVMIISALLMTPVFKNGLEVRENTYLKPFNEVTNQIVLKITEFVDLDSLNIDASGADVEAVRQNLEAWLVEQGILDGETK